MQNNNKIYVIRYLYFWYTDEWYTTLFDDHDHFGNMTNLFENKEQAIQKWKQLEYDFSHKNHFENILYCDFSDDYNYSKADLSQKTADELFEIIQQRDCAVFGLYEYPKQLEQQVFFDPKQKKYDSSSYEDEYYQNTVHILHTNFIENDPLLVQVVPQPTLMNIHKIELQGSVDELSDTPILLKNLIQNDPNFEHYENRILVKAGGIAKINPLLKQAIDTQIRYLSLEKIYQLEQSLYTQK